MRLILLLFFLFTLNVSNAQQNFSQIYDFGDSTGVLFRHLILKEDTLIIGGTITHPQTFNWGLYFAKADTLGNILDYKTHFDIDNGSYVFSTRTNMIETSDGGYVVIGSNPNNNTEILFKLNQNGDKEFFKQYENVNNRTRYFHRVIESENGYIIVGRSFHNTNGDANGNIVGIDFEGELLWEVNYGTGNETEGFGGIQKVYDNEYLVGGGWGNPITINNPNEDAENRSIAVKIDALGNILSEWEGEIVGVDTGIARHLSKIKDSGDGNWMQPATKRRILELDGQDFLVLLPGISKKDANYNIIWETYFGDDNYASPINNFFNITKTPDDGWVGVGTFAHLTDTVNFYGHYAGFIGKVDGDGEKMWSRSDTLFSPAYLSEPLLSDVVSLPSGSIIACGQVDRADTSPNKSVGWIIKLDKDGCIEPGCNATSSIDFSTLTDVFSVYPNPTDGLLNIEGKGNYSAEIYGLDGRRYYKESGLFENSRLDLSDLQSGMYFVKIQQENKFLTKKIIVE